MLTKWRGVASVRLRWRALLECGADLQRQKQNYASDGNDPRLIGAPMPASQPQLTHTNGTALKKRKQKKKATRRQPREGQQEATKSQTNRTEIASRCFGGTTLATEAKNRFSIEVGAELVEVGTSRNFTI
jgi:hypothetical protein